MDGPHDRPPRQSSTDPTEPPREVLAHGDDVAPTGGRRERLTALGRTRGVLSAAGLACALAVGGAWYAGRPTLPPTPHVEAAQPSATGSGTRHAPPQDPFGDRKVEGLYVTHELTAPAAPALDSFIASGSHVLLFLQVRNGGTHAVRVLDGLVAQEGAEPDQSAGGLSAGTSSGRPLEPGRTAEIFVRVQLACGSALQGPPATRLLLVSQAEGRRPLMQAIRIDGLAPLWDEARHAACAPPTADAAVTARLEPGSLRAERGPTGGLVVRGTLRVHDAAGFSAVLLWGTGGSTVVAGGSTVSATVGWDAGTCARPGPVPAPPSYQVRLPDGTAVTTAQVDGGFSADWAAALRAVCR